MTEYISNCFITKGANDHTARFHADSGSFKYRGANRDTAQFHAIYGSNRLKTPLIKIIFYKVNL